MSISIFEEFDEKKFDKHIKLYIIKKHCFVFNGVESFDIKLLGKSSIEYLMDRFPQSNIITETEFAQGNFEKGEITVFINSSSPLFTVETLKLVIDKIEEDKIDCASIKSGYVFLGNVSIQNAKQMDIDKSLLLETEQDYSQVLTKIKYLIINKVVSKGVLIDDISSTTIDSTVEIESGVHIMQNNVLEGKTVIKSGALLKPSSIIKDSIIGCNCKVTSSVIEESSIGDNTSIGPNAYLRPNSNIGNNCRIGDFVEIKNSNIGDGTKASHLSYVGDADVGENVNIGCGVVFVNYNGRKKQRSIVGDNSFIGSNSNVIAPVTIEKNVYIAAGTTVTDNLDELDLCIGRVRQVVKKERAQNYLKNFD